MDRILKISDRANIALHGLTYILINGKESCVAVKKMAEDLNVSVTYLAKILQPLVKEGLLNSTRGSTGGFTLKEKAKKLSLLDILVIIDGGIPKHNCLFNKPICKTGKCIFTDINKTIKEMLSNELGKRKLSDLVDSFK